jgi:hypothetical protein
MVTKTYVDYELTCTSVAGAKKGKQVVYGLLVSLKIMLTFRHEIIEPRQEILHGLGFAQMAQQTQRDLNGKFN